MVAKSQRDAIDRYDAKTYCKVLLKLRIEDDAEIISDMESAVSSGIPRREWLKGIYEKARLYDEIMNAEKSL